MVRPTAAFGVAASPLSSEDLPPFKCPHAPNSDLFACPFEHCEIKGLPSDLWQHLVLKHMEDIFVSSY